MTDMDKLCGNCQKKRRAHFTMGNEINCPNPDGTQGEGIWVDYPTLPFIVECLNDKYSPASFLIAGIRYTVIGFNTKSHKPDKFIRFILAESPDGYSYDADRFKVIYSATEMVIQRQPIIEAVPMVKEEPPFDFRKYYYGEK